MGIKYKEAINLLIKIRRTSVDEIFTSFFSAMIEVLQDLLDKVGSIGSFFANQINDIETAPNDGKPHATKIPPIAILDITLIAKLNQEVAAIDSKITAVMVSKIKATIDSKITAGHKPAGGRRPIPDNVKMFVWQRDGGRCVKCGSQLNLEFEHIIPIAKGGSNTARNLQLLCENCNRLKGAGLV